MGGKSATCVGKKSGRPLTEYHSQAEAQNAADYVSSAHGREMTPYRCARCGYWHLSPTERQTPSKECTYCSGSDGRPKANYESQSDAERRAEILCREQGVTLRAYPCPYGGWHLTKSMSFF